MTDPLLHRWVPRRGTHKSTPYDRHPETYERVVAQFDVENCARYRPENGATWCNIFVGDVTMAMLCHVPHWVDRVGMETRPGSPGARETTANFIAAEWMPKVGARLGWRRVTHSEAQAWADSGCPAVATWRNPSGPGHVAVVVPSRGEPGVWIAQAGVRCFSRGTLEQGFGKRVVDVWAHE